MRAKEYLEVNKSSIKHFDEVNEIVNQMMPLRHSKDMTDNYFNNVLSADIRRQNYLLQKDLFEKNNAMQPSEPIYNSLDGEIPIEMISEIRENLFNVINEDDSFGYLFFLLGTFQNSKHKNEPIDCIPNHDKITQKIKQLRDDYPKQSLDDYIEDDLNYSHYDFLVQNNIFLDNEVLFVEYFNELFRIYDELRCLKFKILKVRNYCQKLATLATKEVFWQLTFITSLIDTDNREDVYLQRCKIEIQKILNELQFELYPQGVPSNTQKAERENSNVFLSTSRGRKINFLRVVNCLYELDYFKDKNQNNISKKDVFMAMGRFLGIDLSTYQNDLSVSKSTANKDMKSTIKIFEEMLEKQKEINQ